MGQLLFQYLFNPILETVNQFQYHWEMTTEYGLRYQRYAALSDASIFNAPVAITKVATGVSRIQDLFVDKVSHPTTYLHGLATQRFNRDMNVSDSIVLQYLNDNRGMYSIGLSGLKRKILPSLFSQVFVYNRRHDREGSYQEYHYWLIKDDQFFLDSDLYLKKYTQKHGNWFSEKDVWAEKEYNLKTYDGLDSLSKPKSSIQVNLFDVLFGEHCIKQLNILKSVLSSVNILVLNVYPNAILDRIGDDVLERFQIHYSLCKTNTGWNVHSDEFLRYRDKIQLNEFENILVSSTLKQVYADQYQSFGRLPVKILNPFENLHISSPSQPFSQYNNIFGERDDRDFRILNDISVSRDVNRIRIYEDISGEVPSRPIELLDDIMSYRQRPGLNIYENIYCRKRSTLPTAYFDFYFATPQNRDSSAFQALFGYRSKRYAGIYSSVLTGIKDNEEATLKYRINRAFKDSRIASRYHNIFGGQSNTKNLGLILRETTWGLKSIRPVFELSLNDFGIRQKKYIFTVNGTSAFSVEESINIEEAVSLYRVCKSIMTEQDSTVMGYKRNNKLDTVSGVWTDKYAHDIVLSDYFLLGGTSNVNGKQMQYQDNISAYKTDKNISRFYQVWAEISDKKLDYAILRDEFGFLDKKKTSDLDNGHLIFGEKHQYLMDYVDDYVISSPKTLKDIYSQDIGLMGYKANHVLNFDYNSVFGLKAPRDFSIEDSLMGAYKESREMYLELIHLWFAYKAQGDFVIFPWDLFSYKTAKDMKIQDLTDFIYKDSKEIPDTDLVISAIKDSFSFVVTSSPHPPKWEDIGGFIVPVSKVRKGLMDKEIDEMVKKTLKFAFEVDTDKIFGSVIPSNSGFPPGDGIVWFDKFPHKVFIDYETDAIIKSKIHGAIYNDPIVGIKQGYRGMLEDSVWTQKNDKILQVQPQIWTSKKAKQGSIFDFIGGTSKEIANASAFQEYWLEKLPDLCYYSYGTWLSRENYSITTSPSEFAFKSNRKAMISFTSPLIKSKLNAWYDEYYFGDRIIKEGQLAAEIEWLEKTRRKCGIHPNDFGNWAWVYETPDPFDKDAFGIDELLLPQNDTHYENFEDLIFDREHMRPRKPVKLISDTQWIAKYPIRHPTQKWSDVAVDYDASAIDWENYYGIETSVMHDIFLRYYRVWQVKMFEFSTMTMQQAVNLMLEYIWAWIPEYFPVKQLEEAYRVFKLIRWFGEAAVINNSQYIISYEYDNGGMKVKTDKKTGKKLPWGIYGIETDLKDPDGGSNDTMFIDRKQFVIRNNPIYVGTSPAWVEFKFTAKRNTTVSFTLMNTIGSVNIYVDGNLEDVRSVTSKIIIPIQYTGFETVIRIEKTKANNLNNQFMIGNLIVPEQDFKDLTIEFDPQLRAGNKPLNEIAQKLIAYAMLHDQKNKAWDAALKANLGVSEVYKKMTRYWNDHHEGKIKGKRLTIKQV